MFESLPEPDRSYLQDLCERVENFMDMRVAPPLQWIGTSSLPVLGIIQQPGFPARITGKVSVLGSDEESPASDEEDSCFYSFVEVTTTNQDCQTTDMQGGRIGFKDQMPAKELTDNADVPTDAIVWLTLADTGDHYLFVFAQGGGISGGSIIRIVRRVCRLPMESG